MLPEPVFYTWTAQRDALPIDIVSGHGARFTTVDGADWIDLGSITWNAYLGQSHPRLRDALANAVARGLVLPPNARFTDKTHAAQALLRIAPPGMNDGRVFFCLSGAEANENAIKMALLVGAGQGRRKIIHRSRSYHGATLAMLAVSGDPRGQGFHTGCDMGIAWADPYQAEAGPGDLEDIIVTHGADQIAAVLLEGVVGANGVTVWPSGYYRRIRSLCDRHGILLIVDEVLSGFGRTGRWFAIDHDEVAPDILTCGKGLTAGYAPGGAVIVHPRIAHHFDDHTLSCGLTHYAHPLTVAAAAAAIEVYQKEGLVDRVAQKESWLRARLERLAARHACVRNLRGLGFLWGIDLCQPDGRTAAPENMKALAGALRVEHLHLHKRDHMLFLAPPLVIGKDELEEGLGRLERALDAAFGDTRSAQPGETLPRGSAP